MIVKVTKFPVKCLKMTTKITKQCLDDSSYENYRISIKEHNFERDRTRFIEQR